MYMPKISQQKKINCNLGPASLKINFALDLAKQYLHSGYLIQNTTFFQKKTSPSTHWYIIGYYDLEIFNLRLKRGLHNN